MPKQLPADLKVGLLLLFRIHNRDLFGAFDKKKHTSESRTKAFNILKDYCKEKKLEQYGLSSDQDLKDKFAQWKYALGKKNKKTEKSGAKGPKPKRKTKKTQADEILDHILRENKAHRKRKINVDEIECSDSENASAAKSVKEKLKSLREKRKEKPLHSEYNENSSTSVSSNSDDDDDDPKVLNQETIEALPKRKHAQKCNICNKVFANLTALTAHMAKNHGNSDSPNVDEIDTENSFEPRSFLAKFSDSSSEVEQTLSSSAEPTSKKTKAKKSFLAAAVVTKPIDENVLIVEEKKQSKPKKNKKSKKDVESSDEDEFDKMVSPVKKAAPASKPSQPNVAPKAAVKPKPKKKDLSDDDSDNFESEIKPQTSLSSAEPTPEKTKVKKPILAAAVVTESIVPTEEEPIDMIEVIETVEQSPPLEPEIKLPQTLESDDDLFNLVLTREDMKSPDRHPKNAFFRLDLSPPAQDFNLFNPGTKNASTQTDIALTPEGLNIHVLKESGSRSTNLEIQSWDTHPELNSDQITRKKNLAELKIVEERARNEKSQADAKENLANYYKLKYEKMKKKSSGAESSTK